jgi:hypothetical protein
MPFSRAQNKATLDRILKEVFADDEDDGTPGGNIRKALATDGVLGITHLAAMDAQEISSLSYVDTEGATVPLKRYQVRIIKTFKGHMYHPGTLGKPLLSIEDWDEFDHGAFNNFRVSTSWMVLSETGLDGAPMATAATDPIGRGNPMVRGSTRM